MRHALFLVSVVLSSIAAPAQHRTAAVPARPETALTPASLKTDNLNYGDDFKRLYVGDFNHLSLTVSSTEFSLILGAYIEQYSRSCAEYLPPNKVEIMEDHCDREEWRVNRYGEIPGTRHCAVSHPIGTGRYADPQLFALNTRLAAALTSGVLTGFFSGLSQKDGDPNAGMKKITDLAVYTAQDSSHFIPDNTCASPALKRFQENMLRFGQGESPLVIAGAEQAVPSVALVSSQNYAGFIDDLITEESHAWVMNRFQAGSVAVQTVSHNHDGSVSEIAAAYTFLMLGSPAKGQVRVTFQQNVPQCLYFADAPAACRAPNPGIISAFKRNRYAGADAASPASEAK